MNIYTIQPPLTRSVQNNTQTADQQPDFTLIRSEKGSLFGTIMAYRRNEAHVSYIVDVNGKVYKANHSLINAPYIICAVTTKDQPLSNAQDVAIEKLKVHLNTR